MNRIGLGLALGALLLAMPVSAQDRKPSQTLDALSVHCADWTAGNASGRASYLNWVLDYIAAHDAEPDRDYYGGQIDLTEGLTGDDLAARMDGYCAAHPRDSLAHAAAALISELGARWVTRRGGN
jgi:hypothetical protein